MTKEGLRELHREQVRAWYRYCGSPSAKNRRDYYEAAERCREARQRYPEVEG